MKRLLFTALAAVAPISIFAQVFSDDFTTDTSLATPPWYNLNNTSAASAVLNPSPGQGLALNVSSGTGKVNEEFAQFSTIPLSLVNIGDSVTLTVNFNSPNIAGNTGGLLVGLFSTQGTVAAANETTTLTGGATADDTGYFSILGYNTSAGTSTKFYSRQGGAADANELGYYSSMTSGSYTQVGSSFAASGNATLANNTAYTLTYTVTKLSGGNSISAMISQAGTAVDNWTVTDASGLYNNFDEFDFGFYGKNALINGNVTSVQVVPEPGAAALLGMGILGAIGYFRRQR